MCRFVAYLGQPILLDDVLYKPKNSLIHQSIYARETPEHLNGDGFGVGWYSPQIQETPVLFTSTQPAWSNRNLRYLASCVKTNCFFAHVRAASAGETTELNCHPFHHDKLLFMHNGDISDFDKFKRRLRHELRDEIYNWLKGQTDSEHVSALFLEMFIRIKAEYTAQGLAKTLMATINKLEELQTKFNIAPNNYITFAVTDGKNLVVSRYASDPQEKPTSLHYCVASCHEYQDGVCYMTGSTGGVGAVMVASEKLDSHRASWQEVPANQMIIISHDLNIEICRIT